MAQLAQPPLKTDTEAESYRYDIKRSLNTVKRERDTVEEVYEWLESCVFAVICILLIFTFVMRTATVSGPSMEPTLHGGDRLVLLQAGYSAPEHGDVVVIDRTQSAEPPIIKRVIGTEGDVIDIDFTTGQVKRNGETLNEPYIREPTVSSRDVRFPVTVPEGALFVMGDNRNHSLDSRAQEIGMIDLHRVMGRAAFRFFPLRVVGPVE